MTQRQTQKGRAKVHNTKVTPDHKYQCICKYGFMDMICICVFICLYVYMSDIIFKEMTNSNKIIIDFISLVSLNHLTSCKVVFMFSYLDLERWINSSEIKDTFCSSIEDQAHTLGASQHHNTSSLRCDDWPPWASVYTCTHILMHIYMNKQIN